MNADAMPEKRECADAVCFTAGPKGAAFGAGAVHAWLASDREPPLVVAGISTGAVTAAALRRVFQELESAPPERLEEFRWTWYRRYLDAVSVAPLDFMWKSFPDPVDYFADKPPVRDLATEFLPEGLKFKAAEARRHFHILTKFGVWLAGLPIRVRTVACILVSYVRLKENRKSWPLSVATLIVYTAETLLGLWWHLVRSPKFFAQWTFRRPFWKKKMNAGERRWIFPFRPLFGWALWLSLIALPALLLYAEWRALRHNSQPLIAGTAEAVAIVFGLYFFVSSEAVRWVIPRHLLRQLDVTKGILNTFELKRSLYDLFGPGDLNPVLKPGREMHALLVCAALQQSEQVWPRQDVHLVEALTAALTIPGIFPPEDSLSASELVNYKASGAPQLVDGVAVRNNPIPAFFEWCRSHPEVTKKLEANERASLHVIYNVP
ncbi:MAG TPA: hypothetical protein VG297_19380, partial [Bryobacteraceae bacterium]|nr:hypothetical protein [Bryobacteraceae bacterium]